jgi:hypothetical protein
VGGVGFVLVLLLRDFLLFGQAFYERDVQTHWYAQAAAFFAAVSRGAWPVWDPAASFGEPLWAYPTLVAYPTTWLHLILPPWLVYTTTVVVHLLLSGLGFYALARRLEVSHAGALAGACCWVASGPLLSVVNMINNVIGAAWLPWIALAAATALDTGRAFHCFLWGASLAAPVLAGSEAALMGGLFSAADTLRRVAWARPLSPVNLRLARTAAVALAFALGLAAAQWLPTLELTTRTARQALPRDVRTDSSLDVLSLAQVALPFDIAGLPFRDHGTGRLFDTQTFLGSVHLGVPLIVLALAAFVSRHRSRAWFFGAAALLAAGFALGRFGPVYDPLTLLLPLLRAIRFPVKAMLLVSLCVCVLAAMGFDAWREGSSRRSGWRRWVVAPAAGLAGLAVLLTAALQLRGEALAGRVLVEGAGVASWDALLEPRVQQLAAGAVAAVLALALAVARERRPAARGIAVGAALLAVVELVAFHRDLNPSAPRELLRYCPPGVAAVGPPPGARLYSRTLAAPTGWRTPPPGMSSELAVALTTRDYLAGQIAATCGFKGSYERDAKNIQPPFLTEMSQLLESRIGTGALLRLLRIGAVTHVAALDTAGLEALRPAASHRTPFGDVVHLLAVPGALPRTYAVGGARIADGPEALETLLDPGFDPRREVVLAGGSPGGGAANAVGTSRIVAERADRVEIEADLHAPGYVVLVDVWDTWWTARVDGAATPVARANGAFRAVRVGPGRHRIVFRYESWPIRVGLACTLAALALGLGLALRELRPNHTAPAVLPGRPARSSSHFPPQP